MSNFVPHSKRSISSYEGINHLCVCVHRNCRPWCILLSMHICNWTSAAAADDDDDGDRWWWRCCFCCCPILFSTHFPYIYYISFPDLSHSQTHSHMFGKCVPIVGCSLSFSRTLTEWDRDDYLCSDDDDAGGGGGDDCSHSIAFI